MKKIEAAQPYAAAFMLIKRGDQYLFVRRAHTSWMDGYYGLPSGKVEPGEGFFAAAIREAKEEVGVTVRPENATFRLAYWLQNEEEPDVEWCNVVFFAEEWEGEPYNAEPHMHDEVAWFRMSELPHNVIPSVRSMLEAIERGESYGEYRVAK